MMNSLLLLFVRWDVHPTLFTFGPVEIRYYGPVSYTHLTLPTNSLV